MGFELSKRSNNRLNTVDPRMQYVVREAIKVTKVDFGVICGKRTEGEQRKLVESGASQTMKSKHLDGIAVDLMAYVGSRASWELNLYDDIADAMAQAARKFDIGVCWGAAWATYESPYPMDIRKWSGEQRVHYPNGKQETIVYPPTMEGAMNSYIDLRREQGRRPFIDGPHFELII